MTKREREKRRKRRFPAGLCLGHIVKSCMTVIVLDGELSVHTRVYADHLMWSAIFMHTSP